MGRNFFPVKYLKKYEKNNMQETYSINSKVENGMLTYNKNKVSKAIADLEGKDIEIIIKRRYRRR